MEVRVVTGGTVDIASDFKYRAEIKYRATSINLWSFNDNQIFGR